MKMLFFLFFIFYLLKTSFSSLAAQPITVSHCNSSKPSECIYLKDKKNSTYSILNPGNHSFTFPQTRVQKIFLQFHSCCKSNSIKMFLGLKNSETNEKNLNDCEVEKFLQSEQIIIFYCLRPIKFSDQITLQIDNQVSLSEIQIFGDPDDINRLYGCYGDFEENHKSHVNSLIKCLHFCKGFNSEFAALSLQKNIPFYQLKCSCGSNPSNEKPIKSCLENNFEMLKYSFNNFKVYKIYECMDSEKYSIPCTNRCKGPLVKGICPGNKCISGWQGENCNLKMETTNSKDSSSQVAAIILGVLAGIFFIALISFLVYTIYKKKLKPKPKKEVITYSNPRITSVHEYQDITPDPYSSLNANQTTDPSYRKIVNNTNNNTNQESNSDKNKNDNENYGIINYSETQNYY